MASAAPQLLWLAYEILAVFTNWYVCDGVSQTIKYFVLEISVAS